MNETMAVIGGKSVTLSQTSGDGEELEGILSVSTRVSPPEDDDNSDGVGGQNIVYYGSTSSAV